MVGIFSIACILVCVCVCMVWLGVSSWPIVDPFRQAYRLLGPQVPETVMGTLFNWGNRRAFRDLLIKRSPANTHSPQQ